MLIFFYYYFKDGVQTESSVPSKKQGANAAATASTCQLEMIDESDKMHCSDPGPPCNTNKENNTDKEKMKWSTSSRHTTNDQKNVSVIFK